MNHDPRHHPPVPPNVGPEAGGVPPAGTMPPFPGPGQGPGTGPQVGHPGAPYPPVFGPGAPPPRAGAPLQQGPGWVAPAPSTSSSGGFAANAGKYVVLWAAVQLLVLVWIFWYVFNVLPAEKVSDQGGGLGMYPYVFLLASPVMLSCGALVALPFARRFTAIRALVFCALSLVLIAWLPVTIFT